ncbi:uncharacterized protein L201_000723 [Kwoniella dendrophila CBS 6074]|uniref:BZIP domain-containing protein n=1 Tax=Kwoniella dendrophila CBS 6074 TaxID=1295534 RepID=A0AAX4JKF7_9TREE
MPQPLRPTDSFNSSTATIVPDKRRTNPNNLFFPQGTNGNSRTLVSTNSLEGHINTALGVNARGDDGMIDLLHTQAQDMGGNPLAGLSFMREFVNIPEDSQQSARPSPTPPSEVRQDQYGQMNYNFVSPHDNNTFEPISTSNPPFEPITSPHSTFEPIPSPNPSIPSNPFSTLISPVHPMNEYSFRPSSASSHHSHSTATSSVDASEYYSTTDMDTDEDELASISEVPPLAINSHIGDLGMADMDLTGRPAIMTWTQYQPSHHGQLPNNRGVSPNGFQSQSQSPNSVMSPESVDQRISHPPPTQEPSTTRQAVAGPSKTKKTSGKSTTGMTDEDKIKADKLEHRRDINRRSAQKHRLQRKKEMENMTMLLAEKDGEIQRLRRDLEVEKARNDQLRILMNTRLAGGAGNNT